MTDLDLDALAAVAEAENDTRPGPWCSQREGQWEWSARDADGDDLGSMGVEYRVTFDPPTILALIAEVRRARAEAIRENAQMLAVQDELNEALDSICEHKAAMTDMRQRKESAEAELELLRGDVAALADEWEAQCVSPDRHTKCKGARLRALIGGIR